MFSTKRIGCIVLRFKDRHTTTASDLDEVKMMFAEITNGDGSDRIKVIAGSKSRMTKEARDTDFFAFTDYKVDKMAIVISDFFGKVLGNWYMKYITQPKFEYKIFDSEEEADEWLK
ncbi:MAG: hypothetical protein HRT72_02515 [Flavobacteriales bacterium]|nr:hypothetical protein [Flavobacteriales bacterium]